MINHISASRCYVWMFSLICLISRDHYTHIFSYMCFIKGKKTVYQLYCFFHFWENETKPKNSIFVYSVNHNNKQEKVGIFNSTHKLCTLSEEQHRVNDKKTKTKKKNAGYGNEENERRTKKITENETREKKIRIRKKKEPINVYLIMHWKWSQMKRR